MERNKNIEAVRGIAIFYMIVYHCFGVIIGKSNWVIESLGQISLVTFFVLSGFGVYLNQLNSDNHRFKPFIVRRLKAIAPQYYFAFFMLLLFTSGISLISKAGIKSILVNLLFVQNYFPYESSLNGATWTVAVILQFYFVAIPMYKLIHRFEYRSYITILVTTLAIKCFLSNYVYYNNIDSIYYVYIGIRYLFTTLDLFAVGMLAAHYANKYPKVKFMDDVRQRVILCIGILGFLHFSVYKIGNSGVGIWGNRLGNYIFHSNISVFIALILFLMYSVKIDYTSLVGKLIQFYGKNEYSIYLWHLPFYSTLVAFQPEIYVYLKEKSWGVLLIMSVTIISIVGGMISCIFNKRLRRHN